LKWTLPKNQQPSITGEWEMLIAAVDQARLDWQRAQQITDMSEGDEAIDNAIYYQRLTEIRYMFLMDQARRYRTA
jgi:hypothetical protein